MSGFALTPPEPVVHIADDDKGRSYTPEPCARAIVWRLSTIITPETMWEPCVGGGAFIRCARDAWPGIHVFASDIDPDAPGLLMSGASVVADARRVPPWMPINLAITNPPFGKAVGQDVTVAIIANARNVSDVCAMLVPLDYLTQTGLEPHVRECSLVAPMLPRPFPHERGMVLLVWDKRHTGPCVHEQLRWKVPT